MKVMSTFFFSLAMVFCMVFFLIGPVLADSVTTDFESPFHTGSVDHQYGWLSSGGYDQAVVANTFGFTSFGQQSLRISDAVTSGSFGDQTFASPLTDAAGEADSTNGTFSAGALKSHYEGQFDMASTMSAQQVGMHISISPDRGDGSRMSYLRFDDQSDGIHVFFVDVQGTDNPANFVETELATISRGVHTIKFVMNFKDGPSNDVVKIYIDGKLTHTGTSWENYYRYDSEASGEQSPRIVKTLLFRAAGGATPTDLGHGFLFDNVKLLSSNGPGVADQCKNGGWATFSNPAYRNQGECVSSIVSN